MELIPFVDPVEHNEVESLGDEDHEKLTIILKITFSCVIITPAMKH